MQINRITLSNHSRIRDLKIGVREHAVIVGANDVGKTSILRMMNFCLVRRQASCTSS